MHVVNTGSETETFFPVDELYLIDSITMADLKRIIFDLIF